MIFFGGKELTNIAPIKIEDIIVSPIQLNPVARQRAIDFGAEFVRIGGSIRNITISFALLESDATMREEYMQAIRDWAQIGKELSLELPEYDTRHLECVATQLPDYSYRKWWEDRLAVVFTCYNNPYWTSNNLMEVNCGTTFTVNGSAPPLMTIERRNTSQVANQSYSDGKDSMFFTRIPSGSMVIDLNRQTAVVGGSSIMRYYEPTSSWITPKTGANQNIRGTGVVKYRERWV